MFGALVGHVHLRVDVEVLRVLLSKCPHLVLAVNLDLNREEGHIMLIQVLVDVGQVHLFEFIEHFLRHRFGLLKEVVDFSVLEGGHDLGELRHAVLNLGDIILREADIAVSLAIGEGECADPVVLADLREVGCAGRIAERNANLRALCQDLGLSRRLFLRLSLKFEFLLMIALHGIRKGRFQHDTGCFLAIASEKADE